jgi:hypothetical protein
MLLDQSPRVAEVGPPRLWVKKEVGLWGGSSGCWGWG